MLRFLVVVGVLLLGVLAAGALWLDRQFEEPDSERIVSLVERLDAKSVMAVLAHPDDEIPIAGLLADAGLRTDVSVRTLTLTRGEAGIGPEPISRPEYLSVVRTGELYKLGYVLGIDEQEVLDYPDGRLRNIEVTALTNEIVVRIRDWKPDIIVTFDAATGLTQHTDHMVAGEFARKAFDAAGDPNHEPSLGGSHAPKALVVVLAPRRMLNRFGGEPGKQIAAAQPDPQYAIDVDFRLKLQGWAIHESQSHVISEVFGVPARVLYAFWDKEHYAVVVRKAI